jgi:hypothetical protein
MVALSNGTACLGEFSDERILTSEHTLFLYAGYIAPEIVVVKIMSPQLHST